MSIEHLETTGFGDRLRQARLARGWTQDELAERASLSVQAIGALERGARQAPRHDTVRLLAAALELDEQERADFETLARAGRRPAAYARRSWGRTLPPTPPPPAADVTLAEEPVAPGSPLERAAPLTTGMDRRVPSDRPPESEFDASPQAIPVREGGVAVSSRWRVQRIVLSGKRLRIVATAGLVLLAIVAVLLVVRAYISRQPHVATVYRVDPRWSKPPPGPGPYLRPAGVAVDRQGNIFVSDAGNNRIQKLSPAGRLLHSWGSRGTGPGQLTFLGEVAVDGRGDVYVADGGNSRIDMFSSSGAFLREWNPSVTEFGFFSSLAVDRAGNVYVSVPNGVGPFWGLVRKFSPAGKPLTQFPAPVGSALAVDRRGTVYVTGHASIEKFHPDGTSAGRVSVQNLVSGERVDIEGLAVDREGHLYVADAQGSRILKLSARGRLIATLGGPGAAAGRFRTPVQLTVDQAGNLYVADTDNNRIQKLSPTGQPLGVWGSRAAHPQQVSDPRGVAVDSRGRVYVTEEERSDIAVLSAAGRFLNRWGTRGSGSGQFSAPRGIAVDDQDRVYVADMLNNRIEKLSAEGTYLAGWGHLGSSPGEFNAPSAVAVDSAGNIYVGDTLNRIQKLTSHGKPFVQWELPDQEAGVGFKADGVAVDSESHVYVAGTDLVKLSSDDGTVLALWHRPVTDPFRFPDAVAVDGQGSVYVVYTGANRIEKRSPDGRLLAQWGTEGSAPGQFNQPAGITVDRKGNVYVADAGNNRIEKFVPVG